MNTEHELIAKEKDEKLQQLEDEKTEEINLQYEEINTLVDQIQKYQAILNDNEDKNYKNIELLED